MSVWFEIINKKSKREDIQSSLYFYGFYRILFTLFLQTFLHKLLNTAGGIKDIIDRGIMV